MKAIRALLILLCSVGLGLAIGTLFRKAREARQEPASVRGGPMSFGSNSQAKPEPKLSFIQQLERQLAKSDGVTRRLLWVQAVEKASLNEFPHLIELAKGDAGALRIIAMRWIDFDPRNLLLYLNRSNDHDTNDIFSEALFPQWAKRDPQALIKELDAPSLRDSPLRSWRSQAAAEVTRYHPELGLPLFERWSIGMFTPSMRGVAEWAAQNPRHAAEFTLKIRAHSPATAAMKTIGEEWAKIDPAAAMAYANSQQTSLGQILAESALKAWAGRDLGSALEWLAKANETERNRLSTPVVEEWAKSEPAAALVWCEENLKGTRLSEAAAAVLRGAAEKDPSAAARLVLAMRPSAARSAGAVAVAEKILPGPLGTTGAVTPERLAWLSSLDPDATRRVLEKAVRYWPDVDPNGMASFLLTTPVKNINSSVYLLVGRELSRNDPAGALEWANQLPEEARLAGGSDAFARWCQSQPANAMEWLSHVPENDVRRAAYLKTALDYLAYEHNVTERIAAMPMLDRTAALDLAKTLDLPPDRRDRLLSALRQ